MRHGTIVVSGSLAQRPGRGGHAWVFLQYLLGFRRLGWDVLFLDRLEPDMHVDELGRPCGPDRSINLRYLSDVMASFGLEDSFAVRCDGGSTFVGLSRQEVLERTREAAFLLNVMGFFDDEEILDAAAQRVFLDIDPGFGQMWKALGLADIFRGHDAFVTIGENLGQEACAIPDCGLEWIVSPQPVVCERWETEAARPHDHAPFTSVITWRGPFEPIEFDGATYGLRAHEFRALAPLPLLTGAPFELALAIDPEDEQDRTRLARNGWLLRDPGTVAADPWAYRGFIHRSAAEFMVAKQIYVATRSGWISDRSLCYLASGRPVLAQDTGIGDRYPTGEGLLLYRTLDEAVDGVSRIRGDYARHARSAREIAFEHFDSDRVLGRLLTRLGHA